MKLVYAIISNEDFDRVMAGLNQAGHQATKMSTTGGFLRKGNATLMMGVEDEELQHVIQTIKSICGERKNIEVDVPWVNSGSLGCVPAINCGSTVKHRVEVGGAIIFVTNIEYYERI